MPLTLRTYQSECLEKLTAYLRLSRQRGSGDTAFYECAGQAFRPVAGLEDMPYVCVRVPTGGGKTLMAAHAIRPAIEHWLQRDVAPVIWLAPSTQIVDQTLDALRDRRHPYRQVLDDAFGGQVSVMDVEAALSINWETLNRSLTVIVTTIQAHRVREDVERRVKKQNGYLAEHFARASDAQKAVLRELSGGDATVLSPTLVNVLRMHRPIVIVDEAHNARSDLSFDMLRGFNPSCIIEFTATPAPDSNVLCRASLAELKAEQMVKLPLRLRRRDRARDTVAAAKTKRDELEAIAIADHAAGGDYVRPIVLHHAESAGGELTPENLKKLLVDEMGVPAEQVAICTGQMDELPDEPIASPRNPVRHVITVQKLREGWDCPFAYVLSSVANLSSHIAVEQIIGRVLRMPYARARASADLNCAYAYVTSPDFHAALGHAEAAMQGAGFTEEEARRAVVAERETGPTLFDQAGAPEPIVVHVTARPDLAAVPDDERQYLSVTETAQRVTIQWAGPAMSARTAQVLSASLPESRDRDAVEVLRRRSRGEETSPAALGRVFRVPGLAVRDADDGQWGLLDNQPAEADWDLSVCDPRLAPSEFDLPHGDSRVALIDVGERDRATIKFLADLDRQILLLEADAPQTPAALANDLARRTRDARIHPPMQREFLLRMVQSLIDERGIPFEVLARHRFALAEAAAGKIAAHRLNAEHTAYQHLLNDAAIDDECVIDLPASYPANDVYLRPEEFEKHFYTDVGAMNNEELAVARLLDSLPEVEYWARNLERKPGFFYLRMPHGRFYPDFVAKLIGDRYLVVEYKGAGTRGSEADRTDEKQRIGDLWMARGEGDLLFCMVGRDDFERTIRAIVAAPQSTQR